jgi:hypothetical protein
VSFLKTGIGCSEPISQQAVYYRTSLVLVEQTHEALEVMVDRKLYFLSQIQL